MQRHSPTARKAKRQRRRLTRKQLEAQRVARLARLPYSRYLKTDHWKRLRARILSRDRYTCTHCGVHEDDAILSAHHETYERRGCERMADLTTLCRGCHYLLHGDDGTAYAERENIHLPMWRVT